MKFGFAREDITPAKGITLEGYFEPRPNQGVYDCLSIKAALFQDENGLCGIVGYDLLGLNLKVISRIIDALRKEGIDFADKLILCTTHTHTGPYCSNLDFSDKEYLEQLITKTVFALQRAHGNLAEAEFLFGKGSCSTLAFNRRFWMKDGTVVTNPGKLNPDIVAPEGTIDPEIPILAIRQNGRLCFLMANISNHCDTIGGSMVSADWPGRMEREIQHELGYDIPVMTVISCQGNINHFNVRTDANQTSYAEACRIGKGYAHAVLSELYALEPMSAKSFKVANCEIPAPYVSISDEEYVAAKETYDSIGEASANSDELTSEDLAKGNPYVTRMLAKRVMECRDNPVSEKRVIRMTSICFGDDLGIVSIPGEPFIEIQQAIKKASRKRITMIAALGQGYISYIGMPESYAHGGGYETRPDPKSPARDLAPKIIDTANALLAR